MAKRAPAHSALLLVDFQRIYCDPESQSLFAGGNDWTAKTARAAASLIPAFKAAGVRTYAVYYDHFFLHKDGIEPYRILPGMADRTLVKYSNDIFQEPCKDYATGVRENFADILKKDGIESLMVCGVALDCCVTLAAQGAQQSGCQASVIEDLSAMGGKPVDEKRLRDIFQAFQKQQITVETSAAALQRLTSPSPVRTTPVKRY